MEENTNETFDRASLFEQPETEAVPKPVFSQESGVTLSDDLKSQVELDNQIINVDEINADTIVTLMNSVDEEGHAPCAVVVTLERIHGIQEGLAIMEYPDENREYVDGCNVEQCSIDLHSFDGNLFNLYLTFDSPKSAYLRELNEILNRYRTMVDEYVTKGLTDGAPALTITIAPDDLAGRGACVMSLPVMFVRCLSDSGENASMLMQFHAENTDFVAIDISEEDETTILADILRAQEEGTGGNLFAE